MLLLLLLNPRGGQRNLRVKTNQKVLAAQQRSLVDHKQPTIVHHKHGKTHIYVGISYIQCWRRSSECEEVIWWAARLPDVRFCWTLPVVYHEWWLAFWRPCWLRGSGWVPCTLRLQPRTCPPGEETQENQQALKQSPQICPKKRRWMSSTTRSHHREGSSRLLQEAHEADFSEVFPWAYALLVWWHHIIRDGGFLQHIGGNMLHTHTHRRYKWVQAPSCSYQGTSLLTWKVTQPTGRYLRSSSMLRYSATRAALWTRHWAASAWLFLSECFPAMFWSHVRRRSGDVW